MRRIARQAPFRLLIAGDGPALPLLQRQAESVNAEAGREVVTLLGHMRDPRPAYQAADVVVGMGTSLLRGMAAGKPAILIGERGLVQVMRPESVLPYLHQGFWGVGDGALDGVALAAALTTMQASTEADRRALGDFGRQLVIDRHGLSGAVTNLESIYAGASGWYVSPRRRCLDAARTIGQVMAFKAEQRRPSLRRTERLALSDGSDSR